MNRGLLRKLAYILYLWFTWVAFNLFNRLILYRTEITITQKCTLKCEKCANLMPLFESPETYKKDDIIKQMKQFLDSVDCVYVLRILGGEPFVHKDIVEIVKCASESSKVKHVEIVTNGTILPSKEIINGLSNLRACIVISDYHELSRHKNELISECKRANIKYRLDYSKPGDKWLDAGKLEKHNRSKKQLQRQLLSCAMMCRNIQDGRLYYCPRASFGSFLGISGRNNDSVDLLNGSIEDIRKSIFLLNQKRMIVACDFCNMGTDDMEFIDVAKQIEHE